MSGRDGDEDPLIGRIHAAPKYGDLSDEVAGAALRWARQRADRDEEVVKRAKRKLHQVFGAFLGSRDRKRLIGALDRAAGEVDDEAWRVRLEEAMQLHASTRERLGEVRALWDRIADAVRTSGGGGGSGRGGGGEGEGGGKGKGIGGSGRFWIWDVGSGR